MAAEVDIGAELEHLAKITRHTEDELHAANQRFDGLQANVEFREELIRSSVALAAETNCQLMTAAQEVAEMTRRGLSGELDALDRRGMETLAFDLANKLGATVCSPTYQQQPAAGEGYYWAVPRDGNSDGLAGGEQIVRWDGAYGVERIGDTYLFDVKTFLWGPKVELDHRAPKGAGG
jgi:hypothetical protein